MIFHARKSGLLPCRGRRGPGRTLRAPLPRWPTGQRRLLLGVVGTSRRVALPLVDAPGFFHQR